MSILTPNGSQQRRVDLQGGSKGNAHSAPQIKKIDGGDLVVMPPALIGWRVRGKVLGEIKAAMGDLGSRNGLNRQSASQEITELGLDTTAIGADTINTLHHGIGIAHLQKSIGQERSKTLSDIHAYLHLPQIGTHGRVRKVFVVIAGKRNRKERREHEGMGSDVVAKSYVQVLESTMIVAVVNREQVRKRPMVLSKTVGHAQTDGEFIGSTIVEFLNNSEQANMPVIVA